MSAYICNLNQIKVLAIYASSRDRYSFKVNPLYFAVSPFPDKGWDHVTLASAYADILYQENVRSVRYRYPDDKWDELPGPNVKPVHCLIGDLAELQALPELPIVQLLKFADCLEYQSCEVDDYKQTKALQLLTAIRYALITDLPGYEEAQWEYGFFSRD
jgi:hypothetical protein